MDSTILFTDEEKATIKACRQRLAELEGDTLKPADMEKVDQWTRRAIDEGRVRRDVFGHNPVSMSYQTAVIACEEESIRREGTVAVLLYQALSGLDYDDCRDSVREAFGEQVATIISGLTRIQELYSHNASIETENFRSLLLSFAEDMRVILLMIADRVNLMRQIRDTDKLEEQHRVAEEASYLYAPLAHKLGLYKLKSELEDLSLKYLEHDAYYMIKEKLNATKKTRDAYIDRFIAPIQQKLDEAGIKCHIKGRTKSIHSIWQKMKKQRCEFEGIYDLFAIRVIIDSPIDKEKLLCWQTYSIVTDMYQPNPKRLRDWLSVPKSNGYECLHITVLGPEQKWVEIQIRTERMDEIAEHGLAAHWRYKGVKGAAGADEWLAGIRAALEAGDDMQMIDQFRMDLYEDEVFVFTPRGDLLKFPKGATVLDFAYHIHSNIGNHCVGARVNGRNVSIRERLNSGDEVEIITQNSQKPKADWLNIVKSSKAKTKIRFALKETQVKEGAYAKEILERKFRNRKIDSQESLMSQVVKKLGFKETADFYHQIVTEKLDANTVVEKYLELRDQQEGNAPAPVHKADEFVYKAADDTPSAQGEELVIGTGLKGVHYQLAKCCRPIFGDPIFGFVGTVGGIKVHKMDCPNAPELRRRFGYRIIKARWSGKSTSKYNIRVRIIGNDDLGIVNNITSIISKEERIAMRSINIDSNDGLFSGNLELMIDDTSRLETLLKKLRTVKGVKQVVRI